MKNKQIQKLVLAASLAAVSVVIDVFFAYALGIPNFGLPFYAIPIILGSIILGPMYGAIMGFVGDYIGVMLSPYGFLPLYVIGPIIWGFLPGLILHKRYSVIKLAWVVPLTYLFVNLSNTLAGIIHLGFETTIPLVVLRMALIPFNSVIIFILVKDIHRKLLPLHEQFSLETQISKT
ncbi:folate family ECF transporter S component [Peloplasma aerotolerans]|jgi:riboflavin transporter|uniref:Folate family ECF transporter S component n=1 Tax=Peloplasma aerotolerans TaxID=3044389 RepID=A0AAW6U4U6_9MOLU|nr:folate family ECF transporter S component [Mariniplasma sp. M4Ah]MDI6452902.1 folate family ECF transporter S component [Mariniplasma sp. M4Ah]MDR4968622.1 folate family ECF transporter S component [Acholeplasmataceae bacterium]